MASADDHTPYVVHYDDQDEEWKVTHNGPVGFASSTHETKEAAKKEAKRLARSRNRPGVVVYDKTSVSQDMSVFGEAHQFIPNDEYWIGTERWKFINNLD